MDLEKIKAAAMAAQFTWSFEPIHKQFSTEANPSAVLELIERLEAAESKQILSASARQFKQMEERLEATEASVKQWEESYHTQQSDLLDKIVEQAALIEKLHKALTNANARMPCPMYEEALAIPTDSKQILAEWLDKVLGEPFGHYIPSQKDFSFHSGDGRIPIFKKPEIK